jgi:NADH-quinone oxidoreductase subunit M
VADNLGLGKYLPAFMGFWGLFAFSSFGFPGTNSFVGEFLVFLGAFQHQIWVGFVAVPGALLAAAYMLKLTQNLAWGAPSAAKAWPDLKPREWAYLALPAVFVLYIGLMPGVFYKVMDASLENMLGVMKRPVAHQEARPYHDRQAALSKVLDAARTEGGR